MRARNNDMQDGDQQVHDTPVAMGDRLMETLLEYLRPRFEEAVGKDLLPTYSCFRVYKPGDSLSQIAARIEDRPIGLWDAVARIFDANPAACAALKKTLRSLSESHARFRFRGVRLWRRPVGGSL